MGWGATNNFVIRVLQSIKFAILCHGFYPIRYKENRLLQFVPLIKATAINYFIVLAICSLKNEALSNNDEQYKII